jgi:GNAT superfamily N-acetyltransferase
VNIDDLRQRPQLADAVVDRIWRAFWMDKGHPIERISRSVERNLASAAPKPFCLIAHASGTFLGTASLIASDVESRPLLTPWVAALWVEAAHRQQGIGTALLEAVVQRAFEFNEEQLFLHSAERRRPFYEKRGWRLFEQGVPNADMHILRRRARKSRQAN